MRVRLPRRPLHVLVVEWYTHRFQKPGFGNEGQIPSERIMPAYLKLVEEARSERVQCGFDFRRRYNRPLSPILVEATASNTVQYQSESDRGHYS